MDDRISFIDKIRGLAIIGVVVLHSDFLNGQCEMITFLQEMFSSSVVIFFAIYAVLIGLTIITSLVIGKIIEKQNITILMI